MLNPASGGASVGVWGRNPSAIKIMLNEKASKKKIAITKQLVEQHGGTIWAQSKFGEGSTFMFTLPIEGKNETKQS